MALANHEPREIPLNRPAGIFSPIGEEGQDEGARFMETSLFHSDLPTPHELVGAPTCSRLNVPLKVQSRLETGAPVLRFTQSPLFLPDLLTAHEPARTSLTRLPGTLPIRWGE